MKLLHVMKEIPQCNPLAVSIEQGLTGAPTVATVTHDDVNGEENKSIDELTRRFECFKNEEFTQLHQEIEKLHEQGTKQIERYIANYT